MNAIDTSNMDDQLTDQSGKDGVAQNGWQKLCRKLFPTGYVSELRMILAIASPLVLAQVCQFTIGPVALIFCGRLGEVKLGAAALSISMINITGVAIGAGLSTSCDTLFSQIYGSENRKKLGVVFQKSLVFIPLCSCPCLAILINAEQLLLFFGQDPIVSKLAGDYLLCFSPGLVAYFVYVVVSKYMQCQNVVFPNMFVGLAANIVNVICHYVSVVVLQYGLRGSAVSQALAYLTFLLLSVGYLFVSRMYKPTWQGWSSKCLLDWGEMVWLSFLGMLMGCAAWTFFEISIFLAGALGTVELGAQSVIFQVETFVYMIPMAIGIAASIRIGQYLGGDKPQGAKTVCGVALTMTLCCSLVISTLEVTLRKYIPQIFTNVPEVVDMASKILPIMAVYGIFEGITAIGAAVVRGCGRQTIGAAIFLFVPLNLVAAVPLMFKTDLGLLGFWYPFSVVSIIQAVLFLIALFLSDWDNLAERARTRVGDSMFLGTLSIEVRSDAITNDEDDSPDIDEDDKIPILAAYKPTTDKGFSSLYKLTIIVVVCLLATLLLGIFCRVFIPHASPVDLLATPLNHTNIIENSTVVDVDVFT